MIRQVFVIVCAGNFL